MNFSGNKFLMVHLKKEKVKTESNERNVLASIFKRITSFLKFLPVFKKKITCYLKMFLLYT